MKTPPGRLLCAGSAIALGLGLAPAAHADQDGGLKVQSIAPMSLGGVAAGGSGVTVFRVNPSSGAVSVVQGSGMRTGAGGARALVTLSCGSDSKCSKRDVRVRVGSLPLTFRRADRLTNFKVAMNTASLDSGSTVSTGPADPVDFTINPIGRNNTVSFYVGADLPIEGDDSGDPTGLATAGFYVYVAYSASTPTSGSNAGLATATVTRALGLSSSGMLNFGTLLRPASGTGTAVVDADQGAYHNYNITPLPGSVPSRVVFTATGEPNKTLSISIPHDFNLVRAGGSTLNVTVSSNAGSSGNLNNAGNYSFGVGGSINVSSTTPTGVYAGAFTVTVAYN